jgi:hypothetical protein
MANRRREKTRPKNAESLEFELLEEFIPKDFLLGDISVGTSAHRHLMFATMEQLTLLRSNKTWYIDGNFRVVREPFIQLLSIHSFVKSGGEMKQVPLMYCIMSGRRKGDYKAVLTHLLQNLPQKRVLKIVIDFERAMWVAIFRCFA